MNIEALLADLRAQRAGLEWEYAGRRSQIDKVISRIEREIDQEISPAIEKASEFAFGTEPANEIAPAPAPAPAPKPSNSKPATNGATTPKGRKSRQGTFAQQLREWVAEHDDKWTTKDVREALGGTHSAVSCTVDKLLKSGLIERVGHGTYKSAGNSLRKKYSEFRNSLKISVPEVQMSQLRGVESQPITDSR